MKDILWKYVIINGLPVLFPNYTSLNHKSFEQVGKVTGVGFVMLKVDAESVNVIGESNSLDMKSKPEDKDIIKAWI